MAISTFVIFDVETTGLPRSERNRTRITELTFLAVDRRDIETASNGQLPLINKLSYVFNPQRNIMPEVRNLTGLSNEALQNQLTFKNRIMSMISFLEELPKPVCLVAHNGNSFDYKLLQTEFKDAVADLPIHLLCVDSLWAFKKILNPKPTPAADLPRPNDELSDDEQWPDFNTTPEEWAEIDKLVDNFSYMSWQNNGDPNTTTGQVESGNGQETTDETEATRNVVEKNPKKEIVSYTLQALYKRLLNKEAVNAHRSEADCLMLLECIIALKHQFIPYANAKCKLISGISPFKRR